MQNFKHNFRVSYGILHNSRCRYNCERLANKLKRVAKLSEWNEPIQEAYFPKLDRTISRRAYAARVANAKLQNLSHIANNAFVDVQDLERWRDTILDAINKGMVKDVSAFCKQNDPIIIRIIVK